VIACKVYAYIDILFIYFYFFFIYLHSFNIADRRIY
jgi:hypothetical protein